MGGRNINITDTSKISSKYFVKFFFVGVMAQKNNRFWRRQ